MTFGLVHASYSLPEWQAGKLTFFAPCVCLLFTSKPFCLIQKETFEGLSQEALSFCIQSLKTASALITQRKVMSSPKCDQHQFSPNELITSSREKLMRFNKMITKRKML